MRIDDVVKRLVVINDSEVEPVLTAFRAFFCVLAAYYLLLPVRDEAAVALGSDLLPRLFGASLPLTLVAAPAASAFLGRPGVSRDFAVHHLYRILAASIVGFAVLHWVVIAPAAPQQQLHQRISDADAAANAAARRQQVARQERLHRGFANEGSAAAHLAGGGVNASAYDSARRALQMAQAVAVGDPIVAANGYSGSGGSSTAGSRMLQQSVSLRHGGTNSQGGFTRRHASDRLLGSPQQLLRAAFYLWVSAANLVAVSTMWARAADAFDAGAAARLFGLLGAGATAGQLAGSAVAGAAAAAARHVPALTAALPALLMLGAAGLLEAAGASAAALAPRPPVAGGSKSRGRHQAGFAAVAGGFRLIAASAYLRSVALFVGLNYVVSSAFYFEKTAVAAAGLSSAASRTALFAAINGASAAIIGLVQLLFTGRLLRSLSPGAALAALPLAAGALMSLIALSPTPATVAGAEVLRKVVAYGIARPAREVLFTVVSCDEKYRAKVVLDTLVQRLGDAIAAAAFANLSGQLGPSGFAAAAAPLCLAWAALGTQLGRQQQALAAGVAAKRQGEEVL